MHTAAKAVEVIIINIKGRCFFTVEGAAPFPVPPGAGQLDPAPHNGRNGRAGPQFIQKS